MHRSRGLGWRGVLGGLAVWAVAVAALAEPVMAAEPEIEVRAQQLEEPEPLELDRDQEAMAEAIERAERIAENEAAVVPLPPGALDGTAGSGLDTARDPSVVEDHDGDGDVEFAAAEAAGVERADAELAADNVPPVLTRAQPAGVVEVRNPQLLVIGSNPDGIPAGGLEYYFKICEDEAMSVGCVQTAWQAANRWRPTHLSWARTYYWNAGVRETGPGGLTTEPIWKIPVTPTVVQPVREAHFGDDPYVEPHEGVNPSIGNFVATYTDVQVAAAGLPVELTRTYNSMDERTGAFGKGWSTFLDVKATSESGDRMLVSFPDGRQERYGQNPDGSWASPPGSASVLHNLGSGWELRRPDQMVYEFDFQGRIAAIRDGWGNRLSITRDTAGLPSRVTSSPSGRTMDLTWAPQGPGGANVITSARTNPAAPGQGTPTWSYRFESGRLVEVCAPGEPVSGAACTTYSYFTSGQGADGKLQRVTPPEGNDDVELAYATNGTVAWVENGTNDRWTFTDGDDRAEGTYFPVDGWRVGPDVTIDPGATVTVDVTGGGGVPDTGVQAVLVEVESASFAAGWMAIYPSGTPEPAPPVSNMDYFPSYRSALQTAAVGADGRIALTNHGAAAAVLNFDVVGWYSKGGTAGGSVFVPVQTTRILDTRESGQKLAAGEARQVQVTGQGGIPSEGVRAVVYDLELVDAAGGSQIASWAAGAPFPWVTTARANQAAGIDNLQVTRVGTGGKIQVYTHEAAVNIRVNVVGYFADPNLHEGNVFRPVTNHRLLDTRDPSSEWNTPWPAAQVRPVTLAGQGPIPGQAVTGVVGDVQSMAQVLNPMRSSASGVGSTGTTVLGQTTGSIGNHLYVGLNSAGAFDLRSTEPTDVIVDVVGYFTPIPRTMYVRDPRTNTTEYRFDSQGRMVGRIDEDGYSFAYGYDDKGYLASERNLMGLLRQLSYDAEGHLISERVAQVRQSPIPDFTEWESTSYFGYVDDPANPARDGRLAWTADGRSLGAADLTYRTNYTYDTLGQPLSVRAPAVSGAPGGVGITRTYSDGTTNPVACPGVAPPGLLQTEVDEAGPTG